MHDQKGFTLVELIVIIGITVILSAVILFSVSAYINKGKDANVVGNMVVLIPAGEDFYVNNSNSYLGFCDSGAVMNSFEQMSKHLALGSCANSPGHPGLCCFESQDRWASCVQEFSNQERAYCVDSTGVKREICTSSCTESLDQCPKDVITSCVK